MTALIALSVALISSLGLNAFLMWLGREERRDLTDRVMALSQPIALTMTRSFQDTSEAKIDYVDEDREYALNPPVQESWSDGA